MALLLFVRTSDLIRVHAVGLALSLPGELQNPCKPQNLCTGGIPVPACVCCNMMSLKVGTYQTGLCRWAGYGHELLGQCSPTQVFDAVVPHGARAPLPLVLRQPQVVR